MAQWSDPRLNQATAGVTIDGRSVGTASVDAGLRSHMLKVYNYMASGVLLTGIVALLFANSTAGQNILINGGALRWLIMLAPLPVVFLMNYNRSASTLQMMFWGFAALMGLSMSTVFLVYTGTSIATTFFATAGAFAGLSLWGYTTKKDLSGWGSFLIMGVVGLIIASIANIFLGSGTLSLVISFIGVLIFAGLTAYDTQAIKSLYFQIQGSDMLGKAAIMGALKLYLDFINMFQFLLSFMGSRD